MKHKSDGSIEWYKARLVAMAFKQEAGIDFTERLSPLVKPSTIRFVLSLAISSNCCLRQLDFKNAFLHAFLNEEVYMKEPPGFIDPARPTHISKLRAKGYLWS